MHLGDEVRRNDVGELCQDPFVSKVPELCETTEHCIILYPQMLCCMGSFSLRTSNE